jgi:sigma-B regulation protein RsbU (phosphoserine phosphatase)
MQPGKAEWSALTKQTFHALDRQDVADLYSVEWQQAKEELIAEYKESIDSERVGWKRWLRKANAVLYGLTKRLAPARRLIFVGALLLAIIGPIELRNRNDAGEWTLFRIDVHAVSFALLTLLLGMELVDKIQLRDELFLARDLQADLVPKTPPEVPCFELGAFNRIANTVGGDIYDFAPLRDGRLAILFGDASGHGMTAGLVMAVTHAAFRTQIETEPAPDAVMDTINRLLCRTGACRTGGPRQFFAGIALLLAPGGEFEAVVAGHPPILRVDAQGRIVERIGKGSYPAGVREATKWPLETGTLAAGDTLLLHSDGLAECRNAAGEEFGDARIEGVVARRAGAGAAELTGWLAAEFTNFRGRRPPEDDVSVAAVRRRTA